MLPVWSRALNREDSSPPPPGMRGIHMQKMLGPCPGSVKDAVVSQIRLILSQPRVHVSRSLRPQLSLCPEAAQPPQQLRLAEPWMSGDDGFQLSSFTVNRKEKNKYQNTPREAAAKDLASPLNAFPSAAFSLC